MNWGEVLGIKCALQNAQNLDVVVTILFCARSWHTPRPRERVKTKNHYPNLISGRPIIASAHITIPNFDYIVHTVAHNRRLLTTRLKIINLMSEPIRVRLWNGASAIGELKFDNTLSPGDLDLPSFQLDFLDEVVAQATGECMISFDGIES